MLRNTTERRSSWQTRRRVLGSIAGVTAAVAALAAPAPTSVGSQPKPGQKLAQESAHGATVAPALARDLVNAQVAGPISPAPPPWRKHRAFLPPSLPGTSCDAFRER